MPDTQLKGELDLEEFIAKEHRIWLDSNDEDWETYIDRRLDERRELRGTYRV